MPSGAFARVTKQAPPHVIGYAVPHHYSVRQSARFAALDFTGRIPHNLNVHLQIEVQRFLGEESATLIISAFATLAALPSS